VDGQEIRAIPLDTGDNQGNAITKVLGKGNQEIELQVEIPAGHHTVTAVAYNANKDRGYEAVLDLDLEPGDMRKLRIVVGKTFGKRLTMKLD
jgi:hypothetical protein